MSVALPDHQDRSGPLFRDARERLVVVAAVLATLGVIALPGVLGALGSTGGTIPLVEEQQLSPNAERVLDELPDAYAAGSAVVVPARTDPHVVWIGPVAEGSVDGDFVGIDVRGLVPFGTLPTRGTTPEWRSAIEPEDRVFSDVGPLYFACTPATSGDGCRGSVLMQHDGRWHVLGPSAGAPGQGSATRLNVLAGGGVAGLWFGWMPDEAATAWATVVGQVSIRDVPVQVVETLAVGGARMWWLRSSEPVSAVSFRASDGAVLERVPVAE